MPNAAGGPTPQELIATVANALMPLGLRHAAADPAYPGNSTGAPNARVMKVFHVATGAQPAAAPAGTEYIVIQFSRAELDARGHEQMASTEYPARDTLPT